MSTGRVTTCTAPCVAGVPANPKPLASPTRGVPGPAGLAWPERLLVLGSGAVVDRLPCRFSRTDIL